MADRKKYISVSTEPAELTNVLAYAHEVIEAGADLLHCDIMDGIAVEKVTYNANVVKRLKKNHKKFPLDVHLMTADTQDVVSDYIRCKPWGITVQYDYFDYEKNLIKTLKRIKHARIKAGIALSPHIPVSYIVPYLKYIDIVLVMGVVPGRGGQKMMEETLFKVSEVAKIRDSLKKNMLVSFDGGVNFENAQRIFEAGADIVVSGSTVAKCFSKKYAIESLRMGEPVVK